MIWFWTRGEEEMRLETRYDNEKSEFVIILHHASGHDVVERFTDIEAFHSRVVMLERHYQSQRWTQSRGPIFLPDGFPKEPLT